MGTKTTFNCDVCSEDELEEVYRVNIPNKLIPKKERLSPRGLDLSNHGLELTYKETDLCEECMKKIIETLDIKK